MLPSDSGQQTGPDDEAVLMLTRLCMWKDWYTRRYSATRATWTVPGDEFCCEELPLERFTFTRVGGIGIF